jgi:hypothetical protein
VQAIPPPDTEPCAPLTTVSTGFRKLTFTVVEEFKVKLHVRAVPEHVPPLQLGLYPADGLAVSTTLAPWAIAVVEQLPTQAAIPAGALVTDPCAPLVTTTLSVGLPNVAVTLLAASIVTVQVPVPEHPAPLHPPKVPLVAVAVNTTVAVLTNEAEQVGSQLMPAGALVTVPAEPPVAVFVTVRVLLLETYVAVTVMFTAPIVTTQLPTPAHAALPATVHPVKVYSALGVAVIVAWSPA